MSRVAAFKQASARQRVLDAAALIKIAETAASQGRGRSSGLSAVVVGSSPTPSSAAVSASSGGCYNQPYVPAWIITRESRGDPTIINGGGHAPSPYLSGGRSWGCAQFMPSTWDRNCRDLGFDVASQIECMRRVSNNGTNLQPWAL